MFLTLKFKQRGLTVKKLFCLFCLDKYLITTLISSHSGWLLPMFKMIIIALDIHLPTTHSAPRSLCMRKTVPWRPAFSECGKSLTRWECGGQWKEFLSSMSTGYLMCCFCSWGPHSSNCEYYSSGFCLFIQALKCVSALQARWRVKSWRRWGGGFEAPDDGGNCAILVGFFFSCYDNCQQIIIFDRMTDPWKAGWCETGLGDWRLHW